MPECQLTLSELVIYLASCPKSNSSAQAIWTAMSDVQNNRSLDVPQHLRSGKDISENTEKADYVNPHLDPEAGHSQDYLGVPKVYYEPGNIGFESEITRRLQEEPPVDPA